MTFSIINGDCLVEMAKMPDNSVDLIFCDLPYGTTACKWDTIIPFEPLWEQYKRLIKKNGAIVLFGSQPFTSKLIMSNLEWFKYEWIWEKNRGTGIFNAKKMPLKSHENILVFYQKQPTYNPQMTNGKPYICKQGKQSDAFGQNTGKSITTINYGSRFPLSSQYFISTNGRNFHPTQKPVALAEYIIKTYTNEGDLVLDNCMGSGTTLVAAESLGRNSIGIELSKEYCAIARARLAHVHSGEATDMTEPTLTPLNNPQQPLAPLTLF